MISLLISFLVLILGYAVYGRVAETVFAPDDRETPAVAIHDGVDCVPLKTGRAFLIQLLNIAGTGPIFGALMGAVFGPVVFLWIVFGSILGGAVHDYMAGMISSRHGGASIAELSGTYLGKGAMWVMRVFSVILLVLCGTVFVTSPAGLLDKLTPAWMNGTFWAVVILVYYLAATLLPIDKLISKLYPIFGVLLITMAAAVIGGILFSGGKFTVPEISLRNLHPAGTPVWPYMFITVACGAISGFHATQSPMIAKCIMSERVGRKVFYGAMISEAVIALVWAATLRFPCHGHSRGLYVGCQRHLHPDSPGGLSPRHGHRLSRGRGGGGGAVRRLLWPVAPQAGERSDIISEEDLSWVKRLCRPTPAASCCSATLCPPSSRRSATIPPTTLSGTGSMDMRSPAPF